MAAGFEGVLANFYQLSQIGEGALGTGLLLMCRYFGFIMNAPVFGRKDVPTQFKVPLGLLIVFAMMSNPDVIAYPRTLEADLAICEKNGVDVVFAPTVAMMYPLGIDDNTRFAVDPPSSLVHRHCGIDRPGHMDGVATVVMKLFTMLRPDIAIFGQKDAQQFAILDAMVTDFGLPIRLIVHPIVRDGNGLALSSRNQYLDTPEKRDTALALFETMKGVATVVHVLPGQTIPVQKAFELSWEKTKSQYPLGDELKWEYFDAVDAETFEPIENLTPNTRLLCAARLGKARLIDNIHVNEVLA